MHLHTVVRTAIENGLDAQKYLTYLFTHLPELDLTDRSALAGYLPWAENVQQNCRKIIMATGQLIFQFTWWPICLRTIRVRCLPVYL